MNAVFTTFLCWNLFVVNDHLATHTPTQNLFVVIESITLDDDYTWP